MARFIDISVPIRTGMVYYPGDASVSVEPGMQISSGDVANLSVIKMGSHTGTHVDAPHHFIDGESTVDRMSLDALVGPVRVLDLGGVKGGITRDDLVAAGSEGAERMLFKTGNSVLWARDDFERGYVFLADEGADYLVEQGARLVGNDYLSIEEYRSSTHYVHHALLQAGIIILEGVDLRDVEPGDYQLVCLPLKIKDGDGAPARAILIED